MHINALSTDYRDLSRRPVNSRTIITEVAIVDQIDPACPVVYLLADHVSHELRGGASVDEQLLEKWGDLFIQVGEVRSINRKKRLIILEDQNIVSCKHLIIARGDSLSDQQQKKFQPGLHALAAALRMQKNELLKIYAKEKSSSHKCTARLEKSNPEETLFLLKIASATLQKQTKLPSIQDSVQTKSRRFFEVLA